MSQRYEGVIRRLRYSDGKPVWGVRLSLHCPCGFSYPQTFVVGVHHPFTHCLRCRRRYRLRLTWNLSGTIVEGQRIHFTMSRMDR